jgi:hypothetical protein
MGPRIFSSPSGPDRLWGSPNLPIQWVPETPSSELKRPGRGAEHLPPTGVEIKKMWIYTSTSP